MATKKTTNKADDMVDVKTVDMLRAEMRVLNSAANSEVSKTEWITPELISMVSSVVVNLITAATVVGWLDATSAQEITKAVTSVIAALGTIGFNVVLVWKYLSGREALKKEIVTAQYRYAETALIERMRARDGN